MNIFCIQFILPLFHRNNIFATAYEFILSIFKIQHSISLIAFKVITIMPRANKKRPLLGGSTSNQKNKRKKSSSIVCDNCHNSFQTKDQLKVHFASVPSCKENSRLICHFCPFVGINYKSLDSHLSQSEKCSLLYNEKESTYGKIPVEAEGILEFDTSIEVDDGTTYSQFKSARVDADGNVDQVVLSVKDVSNLIRRQMVDNMRSNDNTVSNYTFCQRTFASIQENNLDCSQILKNILTNRSSTVHQNSTSQEIDLTFNSNEDDEDDDSLGLEEDEPTSSAVEEDEINIDDDDESDTNQNENTQPLVVVNLAPAQIVHFDNTMIPANLTSSFIEQNQNDICCDIRLEQQKMSNHFKNINFSNYDAIPIDLFHILKASNAPLVLFNRIVTWVKTHFDTLKDCGPSGLQSRENFINNLNKQMYKNQVRMKPRVDRIILSSSRPTSIVTFPFVQKVLQMVSNKSIFHSQNLLLDPINPTSLPPDTGYYEDVNSGTWHSDAVRKECTKENHILMPFSCFIDGLKVDKYGKLTVEAVLMCCMWFNRSARNRAAPWWVHGFVQDQKLFRDQKSYIRDDRAQDYHDMLTHIFSEFKYIRDVGGIKMTLDIDGHKNDVIAIPVIQFIIGDCKGNDLLCGRKGGHSTLMKGLCRDCDVSPENGDDPCNDVSLKCNFITKRNIEGKSREELNQYSFLNIKNCFSELSFGGCERGIYGGTPAEILHALQLGMCVYVAESLEKLFTKSSLDLISNTVIGIVEQAHRQSDRDIPDIRPFRQGLMSVASLKAKERFARVYCLYLAFQNSYLIEELCKKKKKKISTSQEEDDEDIEGVEMITKDFLRGYSNVIESTITFHDWLKQDKFLKSDFVIDDDKIDSKAMERIKIYLKAFKKHIIRSGNGLKTPKFHQMLHLVDYIIRHGCPMNYDGSRGECLAKVKVKDNAKLTNKCKLTLNYDIGRRIAEEDIVDQISTVYFENEKKWPSKYCSDQDMIHQLDIDDNLNDSSEFLYTKPKYHIVTSVETVDENMNLSNDKYNIEIDWGGKARTPVPGHHPSLLSRVVKRLILGTANIGGKVFLNQKIPGYTQIKIDNVIYRSHPNYGNKGEWYDWAYFNWEGIDEPIPGRIMMIIDLTHVDIDSDPDRNPDGICPVYPDNNFPHLTNEKWVIVHAAKGATITDDSQLSDSHFDSGIHTRIELHDDSEDLWMVPLSTLEGPCCVIYNRQYCKNDNSSDNTAYVVQSRSNWPNTFLIPDKEL